MRLDYPHLEINRSRWGDRLTPPWRVRIKLPSYWFLMIFCRLIIRSVYIYIYILSFQPMMISTAIAFEFQRVKNMIHKQPNKNMFLWFLFWVLSLHVCFPTWKTKLHGDLYVWKNGRPKRCFRKSTKVFLWFRCHWQFCPHPNGVFGLLGCLVGS